MALRSHNSNMIGTRASTNSRRALGDVTSAYGNVNQSRVGGAPIVVFIYLDLSLGIWFHLSSAITARPCQSA